MMAMGSPPSTTPILIGDVTWVVRVDDTNDHERAPVVYLSRMPRGGMNSLAYRPESREKESA